MKTSYSRLFLALALGAGVSKTLAQGTAFTYQGRLNDTGSPAHGIYDFRFKLFEDPFGNNQVGSAVLANGISLTNGLFTVTIDFGAGLFTGSNYWLEVDVRTNGGGGYLNLNPLQALTPTPYAIFANTASNLTGALPAVQLSGTVSSANLSGTYGSALTFSNNGNSFNGSFSGNGAGLTNLWKLSGNGGTTPGPNFVGTLDNQPLEFHVNGLRTFRLEPTTNNSNVTNAVNVVGGSPANFALPGIAGATIAGGGAPFYFGEVTPNAVFDNFGTIGGGVGNQILTNAFESTIGGGNINTIYPGSYRSTISGGWNNSVWTNSYHSVIGGGVFNNIQTNAPYSVISGGYNNSAVGSYSTVSGGADNVAGAGNATVGGGAQNQASGAISTVGGGVYNNATSAYATVAGGFEGNAYGFAATVGGGSQNTAAGFYSTTSGGQNNTNSQVATYSAISGGLYNSISSPSCFVGGGQGNALGAIADHSFIGAGFSNVIGGQSSGPQSMAIHSAIAGGDFNTIDSNYGFIGGGVSNFISFSTNGTISGGLQNNLSGNCGTVAGGFGNFAVSGYSTVGGGSHNQAFGFFSLVGGGVTNFAESSWAAVGGGSNNTAGGMGSTVPGGIGNLANGASSFAAGTFAQALGDGAFVWGDDSTSSAISSTNNNSVTFRAAGGYRLFSNSGSTLGVFLAPNASSWSSVSDRDAKKNIRPVDYNVILDKLSQVPVEQWNYKSERDGDPPNLGPMAQDFKHAFYPGRDDKSISTLEFDGVELAAIQALNQRLQQKDAEIQELKQSMAELKELVSKLAKTP